MSEERVWIGPEGGSGSDLRLRESMREPVAVRLPDTPMGIEESMPFRIETSLGRTVIQSTVVGIPKTP